MSEFQLNPEEFLRAANDFKPAADGISQVVDKALSGSAGFSRAWGGDEMGASFATNYNTMREQFLTDARDNATKLGHYGDQFVATHEEYVATDGSNADRFDGVRADVPRRTH